MPPRLSLLERVPRWVEGGARPAHLAQVVIYAYAAGAALAHAAEREGGRERVEHGIFDRRHPRPHIAHE